MGNYRVDGLWIDETEQWSFVVTRVRRGKKYTELVAQLLKHPDFVQGEQEVRMPRTLYMRFPRRQFLFNVYGWVKGRGGRYIIRGNLLSAEQVLREVDITTLDVRFKTYKTELVNEWTQVQVEED